MMSGVSHAQKYKSVVQGLTHMLSKDLVEWETIITRGSERKCQGGWELRAGGNSHN